MIAASVGVETPMEIECRCSRRSFDGLNWTSRGRHGKHHDEKRAERGNHFCGKLATVIWVFDRLMSLCELTLVRKKLNRGTNLTSRPRTRHYIYLRV